jgi:hypothetical protein
VSLEFKLAWNWRKFNDIIPPEQPQAALAKYQTHASASGAVIEHVDSNHSSAASKGRVQGKKYSLDVYQLL